MEKDQALTLFISYSHLNENHINEFIKHIAPLKTNGLIKEWYDRKVLAGNEFRYPIENELANADIICLFISAEFLNSKECLNEKKKSIERKKTIGTSVIPIILSSCAWLDDKDISKLMALPTDGKPIITFPESASAWQNVYSGLKAIIEEEIKLKTLKISNDFNQFLNSTELLTKAHSKKKEVILDDIFVYPELENYDYARQTKKRLNSEELVKTFADYSKIVIAGEDQSGKTTLCKRIFTELRRMNFIPIYVSDKNSNFAGLIQNKIKQAFTEQYEGVTYDDIPKDRIVPIIDDFHFAKKREKHIKDLLAFKHQVIIVDDIFVLNFKDENLVKSFYQFKIKQLTPSLRNILLEKWVHLSDRTLSLTNLENEVYKEIDTATELVNATLGKVFSSGIMPAYPFFVLSIISTYETFEKLDQEITSQGYCYQALIFLFLRRQGVKNDEIDSYINFLTEFAFSIFHKRNQNISQFEFEEFMAKYKEKFNLPIEEKILLKNLQITKILEIDSCGNYAFKHLYLYYFFVAKYLAEHSPESKKIIDAIISNLHINENAYIAIFMSHHSKNAYVLDEILLNAMSLFDKYEPTALTKTELVFLDENIDSIVKAVLPSSTPGSNRLEKLKNQDIIEQEHEDKSETELKIEEEGENDDRLIMELRRSIKTVEVMGSIIKNRAGSLEREKLEFVFEEAAKVHLRILTSFFNLIKDKARQDEVVEFIKNRLDVVIKDKQKDPSKEELEKISRIIFWNLNFTTVYGFINKIVHSLGSDKLVSIINEVCNKNDTPVSFLIKHGILMWYCKNLQIDNIANRIEGRDFSEAAKRIMKFMIVKHCSLHAIGYKERQKIAQKFKIPSQKLLSQSKNK